VIGEAADGATALEKIGAQQPDLVLLDLQMPAMGGLDVYLANPRARAALTYLECGACRDWTR
jgi:YesN/AraC family two-component response regulator